MKKKELKNYSKLIVKYKKISLEISIHQEKIINASQSNINKVSKLMDKKYKMINVSLLSITVSRIQMSLKSNVQLLLNY